MAVLAGALMAAAMVVLLHRADGGRLSVVLPNAAARAGAEAASRVAPRRTVVSPATAACLAAGLAVGVLIVAPVGPLLGLVVALSGSRVLGRLEPRHVRERRDQLLADLPLLLDLLASCLAGGASPAAAASAVGRAVPGPAGERLLAVSTALAVGMPGEQAWAALAGGRDGPAQQEEDPLAPAARALARAAEGGAPVAAAVTRLATEARAQARARGEQGARRVGVLAVAPLGLCFLPAFVLIGVVPVVVGLAGPLLRSVS